MQTQPMINTWQCHRITKSTKHSNKSMTFELFNQYQYYQVIGWISFQCFRRFMRDIRKKERTKFNKGCWFCLSLRMCVCVGFDMDEIPWTNSLYSWILFCNFKICQNIIPIANEHFILMSIKPNWIAFKFIRNWSYWDQCEFFCFTKFQTKYWI